MNTTNDVEILIKYSFASLFLDVEPIIMRLKLSIVITMKNATDSLLWVNGNNAVRMGYTMRLDLKDLALSFLINNV